MWVLKRLCKDESKNSITGAIYHDDICICSTLERIDKAIPAGYYMVSYNQSPAFTKKRKKVTWLPLLYNESVPASRGIRIHAGNTIKDSAGCVLVGKCFKDNGPTLKDAAEAEKVICYLAENCAWNTLAIVEI